jgi:predicted AAA+ superfamily ATPase
MATLLTGRYVAITVHPFSFREYYEAVCEASVTVTEKVASLSGSQAAAARQTLSREQALERYMTYGGLPYAASITDEPTISDYLSGVFSTIILKDVARRRPRINMQSFEAVSSFLADNIGNTSSTLRIADGLSAQGSKVSQGAVAEYIDALIESHLLHKALRLDLKGKQYLQSRVKYYLGDLGFRFWLLGKRGGDVGHRLENIVYLELLRRHASVAIGKHYSREIDFVSTDADGRHYYQVAQTVMDPKTLDRELGPLQGVHDTHPHGTQHWHMRA